VKSACFLRAVPGRQAEPHFCPALRDKDGRSKLAVAVQQLSNGWLHVLRMPPCHAGMVDHGGLPFLASPEPQNSDQNVPTTGLPAASLDQNENKIYSCCSLISHFDQRYIHFQFILHCSIEKI
jgi:hypothetical protein